MMSVGAMLLVKVCMGDKDEALPCPFIRSRNNPSATASTTGETRSKASGPPLPVPPSAELQPTVAAEATSWPLDEIPHRAIRDDERPSLSAFFLMNTSAWHTSENDSTGEFVASASLYSRTRDTKPKPEKYLAGLKSCSGLPRVHAPPCTKRMAGCSLLVVVCGGNSNIRRSRPAMLRYTVPFGVASSSVGSSASANVTAARRPSEIAHLRSSPHDGQERFFFGIKRTFWPNSALR